VSSAVPGGAWDRGRGGRCSQTGPAAGTSPDGDKRRRGARALRRCVLVMNIATRRQAACWRPACCKHGPEVAWRPTSPPFFTKLGGTVSAAHLETRAKPCASNPNWRERSHRTTGTQVASVDYGWLFFGTVFLRESKGTMQTIFFDIETGPVADHELEALMPPFDPAHVKFGNRRRPETRLAKIRDDEEKHRRRFFDDAAKHALTGRVLAVGLLYCESEEFRVIAHDDEAQILRDFWEACRGKTESINRMVGFNIHQFDLPFLIRRSWKHRVPVPLGIRHGRRYWSEQMVDLREEWQLGDRRARGSLESVARHLGVGEKNGHGKDFANLWQTDRESAIGYLRNDLVLTARIADALFGAVNVRNSHAQTSELQQKSKHTVTA
jgi:hypothetical protein